MSSTATFATALGMVDREAVGDAAAAVVAREEEALVAQRAHELHLVARPSRASSSGAWSAVGRGLAANRRSRAGPRRPRCSAARGAGRPCARSRASADSRAAAAAAGRRAADPRGWISDCRRRERALVAESWEEGVLMAVIESAAQLGLHDLAVVVLRQAATKRYSFGRLKRAMCSRQRRSSSCGRRRRRRAPRRTPRPPRPIRDRARPTTLDLGHARDARAAPPPPRADRCWSRR